MCLYFSASILSDQFLGLLQLIIGTLLGLLSKFLIDWARLKNDKKKDEIDIMKAFHELAINSDKSLDSARETSDTYFGKYLALQEEVMQKYAEFAETIQEKDEKILLYRNELNRCCPEK